MRAQYKGKTIDRYTGDIHLFYEYHGHEYMITDYNTHYGYGLSKLTSQHKREQERIDYLIAHPPCTEQCDSNKAWEAIDEFLKMQGS